MFPARGSATRSQFFGSVVAAATALLLLQQQPQQLQQQPGLRYCPNSSNNP